MNNIAEVLSHWFGSTPFIVFHVIWFSLWYPLGGKTETLTLIVSLEAIFLSLFILRAENISEKRMHDNLRQDLNATKRIEKRMKSPTKKS